MIKRFNSLLKKAIYILLSFVILLWITMTLLFGYITISTFFSPRDTEIEIILNDFDSMALEMDAKLCKNFDVWDDHLTLRVIRPVTKDFILSSIDPISIEFDLESGIVTIQKFETNAAVSVSTKTVEVTDARRVSLSANNLKVDFNGNDDIRLTEYICTSGIYLFSAGHYFQSTYVPANSVDESRIVTVQNFTQPQKSTTATMENAYLDGNLYSKVVIIFQSAENYNDSQFTIRSYGKEINFDLPQGVSSTDELSSVSIDVAFVRGLTIAKPEGNVTLQYEGKVNLLPDYGGYSSLTDLKLSNPEWPSIMISAIYTGGYSISGSVKSAIYLGNQLIKSPWQTIPLEIQSTIITTLLGAISYIFIRKVPSFYRCYISKSNSVIKSKEVPTLPSPEIILPHLHDIYVLNSGMVIAGVLKSKKGLIFKKYLLCDTYVKGSDGNWEKGPSVLLLDSRQISYSYVQANNE